MNPGQRRSICEQYFKRIVSLEHAKYDLERVVELREHKVANCAHITRVPNIFFQRGKRRQKYFF